MSRRALAGFAIWTASFTGSALGQSSPSGPPAPAGYAHVGDSVPLANPNVAPNPYTGGVRTAQDTTLLTGYPDSIVGPAGSAPVATSAAPLMTDGLFAPTAGLARGPQCWVGAEYLLYWNKNAPLPVPIASAGPAAGLGILGTPGTVVVLGNSDYSFSSRSGIRVLGGMWFTENQSVGLESNVFVLPEKSAGTPPIVSTGVYPTLARPFYDTATNRQNSRLLTLPNTFAGGISTDASNFFWGAQVSGVWRFYDNGGHVTADAVTGFQFLNLEESLDINDFSSAKAGGTVNFNGQQFNGGTTYLHDHIGTTSRFYGWLVGERTNFHYEAFTLSFTKKIGIGTMSNDVRLDGTSTLAGPYPAPQTTGGAFFTTGNNAGKYQQSHFGFMGELALNLNVQVTSHVSVNFGYNYLILDGVVRPGDQLSTNINSTQVPIGQNYGARFGPASSGPQFNTSSFYVQGINAGLTVGY